MEFKASMDKTTRIITTIITIMFVAIITFEFITIFNSSKWVVIITSPILIISYLLVVLYQPKFYKVNYEELIINRNIGNVIFKRSRIKSVEQIEKEILKYSVRTFGVGGLFGYFGKFYNSKIGAMTWYATRRSNHVLITTTSNKKIILTPDNPEDFVKEFNK